MTHTQAYWILGFVLFLIYILIARAVGNGGKNKGYSFWGLFLISIFFTPIFGALILLSVNKKEVKEEKWDS